MAIHRVSRSLLVVWLVAVNALLSVSTPAAASTGDLLQNIPVVDENVLNNAACGVAAATMILDYYMSQPDPNIQAAVDISAVAQYVPVDYAFDKKNRTDEPVGTTFPELQTGLSQASSKLINVSLAANWVATDKSNWFSALQGQLDAKRPVIVYLPDGGKLGWSWDYPHFVVVSGYDSADNIIYHDPWDGRAHTLSSASFAAAWGTQWLNYSPWWYLPVTPSSGTQPGGATPTTPISSPTSQAIVPGGIWYLPLDGTTITTSTVHVAVAAYPKNVGDPAIAYVNFTVWWPALGDKSGPWKIVCSSSASENVNGLLYECDFDPRSLGAPYGTLELSFDVYDQAGNRNLSPNGERTIVYQPLKATIPPPTAVPPPKATVPSTPVPKVDNAKLLTGPVSLSVQSGQQVTMKFTLRNTGSTIWSANNGYSLRMVESGQQYALGPSITNGGCDQLQPGQTCNCAIGETIVLAPGTYTWHYRMYHGNTGFGDIVTATITVARGSTSAPQPIAPTPTPPSSFLPPPTPVPPATNTPQPVVPTIVPTPTTSIWTITLTASASRVKLGTSVLITARSNRPLPQGAYLEIATVSTSTPYMTQFCGSYTSMCSAQVDYTVPQTATFFVILSSVSSPPPMPPQVTVVWTP